MKSITEIRRWATLRCAHCGHRFHWSRDARFSTGSRDGKVYHEPCLGYIEWRRQAEERLTVVDLLADVSGLNTNDMQAVATGPAAVGEEHTAVTPVWRVFYDLSQRHAPPSTDRKNTKPTTHQN